MKSLLRQRQSGFTLAELLIALGILGVIATFTIPKILVTATNGQNTAIAKEAASMISGSYSAYTLQNGTPASGTTAGVITSYMNYVAVDTATVITPGPSTVAACAAGTPCLKLHNGGYLQYSPTNAFNGVTSTSAIVFNLDPDGVGTATPVTFVQLIGGRFTTNANAGTINTTTGGVVQVAADPSYITNWN